MNAPAEEPGSHVALVTGAAQGIGAAVAERLAADGYRVAALDVRPLEETIAAITASAGRCAGFECDVRSWEGVASVVHEIEEREGPITVVASVAGVFQPVPFLELDPDGWRRVVDVNLTGTFNICRLAAAPMAERQRGAIICISSNAAYLAWQSAAHYSASKAGVVGLVKGMALELGPYRVRVNAICPGTVRSPATAAELSDPEIERIQVRACPIGRIGVPLDIAQAVAFLADERRASWITGEALLIDGGFGTHGEGAFDFSISDSTV
jgi:NAD(P)-dependent dehydrogenase (short-subunit alcohol dehydrogenase family)